MHCFCAIGNELDEGAPALAILKNLADSGVVPPASAQVAAAAISAQALGAVPQEKKKMIRDWDIFRQLILSFMK